MTVLHTRALATMREIVRADSRLRLVRVARVLVAALLAAALAACVDVPAGPGEGPLAVLTLRASVTSPTVSTLVAEVTAADITDPLVFNFELGADGTVEDEITVPTGPARTITVRAFDSDGTRTHEGSATVDVVPGDNPTVTIVLAPLPGEQPITVVLGEFSVDVQPDAATVAVGETAQLTVTIIDSEDRVIDADAVWATDAPAVATVDQTGLVTGVMEGTARIVASFAGVADLSDLTVGGPPPSQGANLAWSQILGPVTSVQTDLRDVWVSPTGGAYAVGADAFGSRTVILRWDGTSWMEATEASNAFHGVWGASSSDVFVVGADGTIRHFDGSTWSFQSSSTTNTLHGVWGTSSSDVFAVGTGGTISHFDGSTWALQNSTTTETLVDVWGSSSTDVWAVGAAGILHYDGTAWSGVDPGLTLSSPRGVWGSGPDDVFVVGAVGSSSETPVLHFDGTGWERQSVPNPDPTRAVHPGLVEVWGRAGDDVYAVGTSGGIYHYDGVAWSVLQAGGPTLHGVWADATGVFAVGNLATILRSTGAGWAVHSTGVEWNGVWGASGSELYAVGHESAVYRYDGSTWTAQSVPTLDRELQAVWGAGSGDVWAVGNAGAILHFDGSGWRGQESGTIQHLNSVWGTSATDVHAVGGGGLILHNGGAGWSEQFSGGAQLRDVQGAGPSAVWAVGNNGRILHYDGTGWAFQAREPNSSVLHGVWAAAADNVFAVGEMSDELLRYDGTAWTLEPFPGTSSDRDVWGASASDVFVVSGPRNVLHFDGSTWTIQDTGFDGFLFQDIWGSSATEVFVVGGGGKVLRGTP